MLWAEPDLGHGAATENDAPGPSVRCALTTSQIIIRDLGAGTQSGINPSSICNRNMNTRPIARTPVRPHSTIGSSEAQNILNTLTEQVSIWRES